MPVRRISIGDDVIQRRLFYTDSEQSGGFWTLCKKIIQTQDSPTFLIRPNIRAQAYDYFHPQGPELSFLPGLSFLYDCLHPRRLFLYLLFEAAFTQAFRHECDQADAFIVNDLNSPESRAKKNDGKLVYTLEQFLLEWKIYPEKFASESEQEEPEQEESRKTDPYPGNNSGVNPLLDPFLDPLFLIFLLLKLRDHVEDLPIVLSEVIPDYGTIEKASSIDKPLTDISTQELFSLFRNQEKIDPIANGSVEPDQGSNSNSDLDSGTVETPPSDGQPIDSDSDSEETSPSPGQPMKDDLENFDGPIVLPPPNMRDRESLVDQITSSNEPIESRGITNPSANSNERTVTAEIAAADPTAILIFTEDSVADTSDSESLADRSNDSNELDNLDGSDELVPNKPNNIDGLSDNPDTPGDGVSGDSGKSEGADSFEPPDDPSPFLDPPPKLPDDEKDRELPKNLGFTYLDFSGGQNTINISQKTSHVVISNFGGVGRGTNPSQKTLNELDTIILEGSIFSVENIIFESNGNDLKITFDGLTNFSIRLKDFDLELFDNIPFNYNGFDYVGNIIFDDQSTVVDDLDVVNEDTNLNRPFSANKLTVFNDSDNHIYGRENSDDIIHAQGGDDYVLGLSGDDILRGGKGDDLLDGGKGVDILYGGSGADGFIFNPDEGIDVIKDFSIKDGDYIVLPNTIDIEDISIYSFGATESHSKGESHIIIANKSNGQIIGEVHGQSLLTEDWRSFIKLSSSEDFLGS